MTIIYKRNHFRYIEYVVVRTFCVYLSVPTYYRTTVRTRTMRRSRVSKQSAVEEKLSGSDVLYHETLVVQQLKSKALPKMSAWQQRYLVLFPSNLYLFDMKCVEFEDGVTKVPLQALTPLLGWPCSRHRIT